MKVTISLQRPQKSRVMKMMATTRGKLLSAIFPPRGEHGTTKTQPMLDGSSNDIVITMDDWWLPLAVSVLAVVVTMWLVVRGRRRRRRRKASPVNVSSVATTTKATTINTSNDWEHQREEYETLIAALQEELHVRQEQEREHAILWRQEKSILHARLLEGSGVSGGDNSNAHEQQQQQQQQQRQEIQALQNTIREQRKELKEKQKELNKLHNILEEIESSNTTTLGITKAVKATSAKTTRESKKRALTHVQLHPTEVQNELERELSRRFCLEEEEDTAEENNADSDSGGDDSSTVTSLASESSQEEAHLVEEEDDDEPQAPSRLIPGNKVVLLVSSTPGNLQVSMHQTRLESIFQHGLGLISDNDLEVVDGCHSDFHTLRTDLFNISGLYAVYPQVFLVTNGARDIQFVGDYDTIVEMHDARTLPERIGLVEFFEHQKMHTNANEPSESSTWTANNTALKTTRATAVSTPPRSVTPIITSTPCPE